MRKTGIFLMAAVAVFGGGQAAMADYASYIAGTSPVGWWGFNDAGGSAAATTTADLSGAYGAANNGAGANVTMNYNNPGVTTVTNEAGFGGAGMGASNKATFFNGNPDWTNAVLHSGATGNGVENTLPQTGDPVYMPASDGFSVEAWIKLPGSFPNGSGDSERIMGRREWMFGFQSGGGTTGLLHFTTVGKQDYFSTTVLPFDQQWHQIGVAYDGNLTANFYIDGLPAGTFVGGNAGMFATLPSGSTNNTFNLGRRRIDNGANLGEGQQFYGWMDEAVIWNGVRTDADYAASYLAATTVGTTWPNYLSGDFNKDGEVGPEDFGILKDNFGLDALPFGSHQSWTLGDANDDGEIGPEDFGLLKDNFGLDGGPTGAYPLTNVPEPTTMALLALGAVGLIRRRRTA
ncbi:MAG: PEP-CTERM sorting domain-containing protein [Planctomycetota bacterium]|nr:PEP-CTERM sorting domain-containing protein [Planctomycetota bacterium]